MACGTGMCALPASGVDLTPRRASANAANGANAAACAACRPRGPMGPQGGKCTCGRRSNSGRPAPVAPRAEARPGVEVLVRVPEGLPGVPLPKPEPQPRTEPRPTAEPPKARPVPPAEPMVPQGPEPPVVERVPSKAPETPQGTVFLTRQPQPPARPPTPRVDLGTSIPLLIPAPAPAPGTPGYCDDPRFAGTELCYKGGVPASQGRGPMAVIEKGNPELKAATVAEMVPRSKPSAGPSHPIVGPTVAQYRPARGPSLSIERASIPASQYMPGQGLLPVSNYMPPSPIKGVSGLAGAGAGVPRAHRGAAGPSTEMVGVPVSQYRPAGLGVGSRLTRAQCEAANGTWDAANSSCSVGSADDGGKGEGGGPDHTDAILGAVSSGIGALGTTITRLIELNNQMTLGRLTAEGQQALELERIRASRDLANAQSALNDARSQGANDSALQALSAQLAALQAQAQSAGAQVGMSLPTKVGLVVGGVALVGGVAYLLTRGGGAARSNPSRSSGSASRVAARRNARRRGRR